MSTKFFIFLTLLFVLGACSSIDSDPSDTGGQFILTEMYQNQWEGSSDHWRWEEGILIGETTDQTPIERSAFLIWQQEVEDFTLSLSFRISENGNSGIYYRCQRGPEGYDDLLGYQADIDGQHNYTGIVYENFLDRHREILAKRGQFVRITETDSLQSFSISSDEDLMDDLINPETWNAYELIVKDALIVQKLNGQVVSMVEDRAKNRQRKGLFGFQLHQGPPMKVEFKDAVFKNLSQ